MAIGLTATGIVVGWGSNSAGRLGIGITEVEIHSIVEVTFKFTNK